MNWILRGDCCLHLQANDDEATEMSEATEATDATDISEASDQDNKKVDELNCLRPLTHCYIFDVVVVLYIFYCVLFYILFIITQPCLI